MIVANSQIVISGFDPNGPFGGLFLPPQFRKRINETRFRQEWRMTLAQYAAMMKGRLPISPFKQRGTIGHFQSTVLASAGPGGNVVLTPHFFGQFELSGTHTNSVRFNSDGGLDELEDAGVAQSITGEWWSAEPAVGIGSSYAVRALSAGKIGTWSASASPDDTWITISSNRQWDVTSTYPTDKSTSAVFEIGPQPSGPADDSAGIQCSVTFT